MFINLTIAILSCLAFSVTIYLIFRYIKHVREKKESVNPRDADNNLSFNFDPPEYKTTSYQSRLVSNMFTSFYQTYRHVGMIKDITINNENSTIYLIPSWIVTDESHPMKYVADITTNCYTLFFLISDAQSYPSSQLINSLLSLMILEGYFPKHSSRDERILNFSLLRRKYDTRTGRHIISHTENISEFYKGILVSKNIVSIATSLLVGIAFCRFLLRFATEENKSKITYIYRAACDIWWTVYSTSNSSSSSSDKVYNGFHTNGNRISGNNTMKTEDHVYMRLLAKLLIRLSYKNESFPDSVTFNDVTTNESSLFSELNETISICNLFLQQMLNNTNVDTTRSSYYFTGTLGSGTDLPDTLSPIYAIDQCLMYLSEDDAVSNQRSSPTIIFINDGCSVTDTDAAPLGCGRYFGFQQTCTTNNFSKNDMYMGFSDSTDDHGIQFFSTSLGLMANYKHLMRDNFNLKQQNNVEEAEQDLFSYLKMKTTSVYYSLKDVIEKYKFCPGSFVTEDAQFSYALLPNRYKYPDTQATMMAALTLNYCTGKGQEQFNPFNSNYLSSTTTPHHETYYYSFEPFLLGEKISDTTRISCGFKDLYTPLNFPTGDGCPSDADPYIETIETYCDRFRYPFSSFNNPSSQLTEHFHIRTNNQFYTICDQSNPNFNVCSDRDIAAGLSLVYHNFSRTQTC